MYFYRRDRQQVTIRMSIELISQYLDMIEPYNYFSETWLADHQSTPLNPKVLCNLSLELFSRISFNDR
jgi:hypothetical protein